MSVTRRQFEAETSRRSIVMAGDWLALGLFVLIGQGEHELLATGGFTRWLTTTAVLALPWTAVALLLGAHKLPEPPALRPYLARALTAWLVAAPLALILRAYLNGQATIVVIFLVITMALGGAFILAWRLLYFEWHKRRNN